MSPVLASDAEREATVERLRAAAADGRLDGEELEQRIGAAYAARTTDDLAEVVADLPAPLAPAPRVPAVGSEALRRRAASFVTVNIICIAIWAATGTDGGFWPGWVLLFTGIGLVGPIVHRALGVEPDRRRHRDRHEYRHEYRHEHRHEHRQR